MICLRKVAMSPFCFGILFGLGISLILLSIHTRPLTHLSMLPFFRPQQLRLHLKASHALNEPRLDGELANYFNMMLTLEGKGVISEVTGGIGNQLFNFACTYALARDLKRPLFNFVPDYTLYWHRKFLPSQRDFALDKFQIPLTNLIDESTSLDKSSISYITDPQLLFRTYPTDNTFLQLAEDNFCTSEAFWAQYKDDIIDMFQIRREIVQEFPQYVTNLGKEIENSEESVAVHVRRGDFKGDWRLPISYQFDSIVKISKMLKQRQQKINGSSGPVSTPKYFIFSDDIEYCRQELHTLRKVYDLVFVSSSEDASRRTTSLQDFFLMTKCKHFIIPNSTFGWWAAYLGTHKRKGNGSSDSNSDGIVIASDNRPGYWKRDKYKNNETLNFYYNVIHGTVLFPEGWVIHYPPF